MKTDVFFELINAHDTITIFRHISPDSDALGSQFGLKQWIKDTYPTKKVYALGEDNGSKMMNFPEIDQVSDQIIANSLAIILDTADGVRVDDARWRTAKHTLKIDHHIIVEEYAESAIVDDLFGATCEIIAYIFHTHRVQISATCAQYLYGGLIADTLRFSISTIKPRTLQVAAYLLEAGVDVAKANEENFSTPLKQYYYENYLRANCKIIENQVAYIIVNQEDYEAYGLTFNEAKEKVFVMGGVHELKAWALFVEKEKAANGNCIYNGSLRSKNRTINDIANAYHGGGHRFACGVKGLTKQDIDQLLQDILERVKDSEEGK